MLCVNCLFVQDLQEILIDVESSEVEEELCGEVGEGDDAQPEDEEEGLQETPGTVEHSHWSRFINILCSDC